MGVGFEEGARVEAISPLVRAGRTLSKALFSLDIQLLVFGIADLFEVLPASDRPKRRPKTAGFFSDFSELKPGDYVVHVDHGIGQFEGLRNLESEGARGEFMLLRYAQEAPLYLPLQPIALLQNYR